MRSDDIYWTVFVRGCRRGVGFFVKERFQAAVGFMACLRREGYDADVKRVL